MISYVKTTILLLSLLCVSKLIQAENVESTDALKSSNDSKTAEHTEIIIESSTLNSLDEVENGKENVEKTTENSTQGGEEKKQSLLQDDTKTKEEKKDQILRRKRRSHLKAIKKKYSETHNQDSSENSGEDEFDATSDSSGLDENDSDPKSSETSDRDGDKAVPNEGHEVFLNFLKTFLNDSCDFIEPYSSLRDSIEKVLSLINSRVTDGQLDIDAIMSFLFNFKEVWEEYCDSPRETKNSLTFFYNFVTKMNELTRFHGFDDKSDSVSQLSEDSSADVMRRSFIPKIVSKVISGINNDQKRFDAQQPNDFMVVLMNLFESYGDILGIPPNIRSVIMSLLKSLVGGRRSNNPLEMLTTIFDTYGDALNLPDNVKSLLSHLLHTEGGKGGHTTRSEGGPNLLRALSYHGENSSIDSKEGGLMKKSEGEGPSLEKLLQKYCELSLGSSDIITTLEALLKEFGVNDEADINKRGITDAMKFLKSIKAIVDKFVKKRSGYEATFIKGILEKYCDGLKRSNSALTSFSKVLVPQDGNNTKRSTLLSSRALLDEYIHGSKGSIASLDYLKYILARYCGLSVPETKRLDSGDKNIDFQKTHTESTRSKVRTKSNIIDAISEKRRMKRREHDDMIGWRHGVFEPDGNQTVSETQTEKSSPRMIKKVSRQKKPKNLKNPQLNLYNEKENGTRTKGDRGQFAKARIIGLKENPSSSFEVKAGVERDTGSTDSNSRLRCNVRTKASMSDAEGRTGSSKGHTFSEITSNDTKTLLCSSETSEVQRPNKDVYIKQSVSGKSIVSYDNPDKYIRPNYSPSKENLEIGTSGFSKLNDTSSKNQSVSVVSVDSQNADSISRSETKFVEGKGNSRGMESSANVEGSIDAVPNKNPFITNSRQHSLGMIVENPDKNMESPLPVEKNEKLQTYSKFQRTEDFDINFRRFDPERSRPEIHHRRRSR